MLGAHSMLDLADLTSLFFEPTDEWREPAVVAIWDLSRFEDEPLFHRLTNEGHIFQFVDGTRLRKLAWTGWEPVTEPDENGRPVIFTDRRGELVLVHRPKQH